MININGGINAGTNGGSVLDAKAPSGPLETQWSGYRDHLKLVAPNNRRKFEVLVVGSGLAGAAAAATLGEAGYNVKCFCFQDSPRRAHSIAAQGGINAAKNYRNDGDSTFPGSFTTRSKAATSAPVNPTSTVSPKSASRSSTRRSRKVSPLRVNMAAIWTTAPSAAPRWRGRFTRADKRDNSSCSALIKLWRARSRPERSRCSRRTEMLDVVVEDGRAKGIVTRDLVSGEITSHAGHAVVLATGGYSNVYFLSTNAKACNVTAAWRAHRRGALFANPCFTQIHPTCIPQSGEYQSKLTLMSESLRNDGRIWVAKNDEDTRRAREIPEGERDYYLERRYPSFGNLVPRDVASRNAKSVVDEGRGVGPLKNGVYLDFADAIGRLGRDAIEEKYGNLFEMYERITGENPYEVPMRIYPAPHYTMGGLWVDYNLMSNVDGLFVIGEANFSDHGANRLGASALMQGLADGYFIVPYTLASYLAPHLGGDREREWSGVPADRERSIRTPRRFHASERQAHGGLVPSRARPNRAR